MARFGEGDPRWLVADRADGTNVNQWHWSEKDCLPWAKERLGELFSNLKVVDVPDKGQATTTGVKSVTGDCVLNIRKAKLVAMYELDIAISWQGKCTEAKTTGSSSGTIRLPYLAEENEDEDPEVTVSLDKEDAPSLALKQLILSADGKKAIHSAVRTFLNDLRSGAPAQGQHAADGSAGAAATSADGTAECKQAATSPSSKAAARTGVASRGSAVSSSTSHLSLSERFHARPSDLFECFTVEGRVRAFTQSQAHVDARPGGKFSWFGGSITGEFEALEPPSRLVMKFRFSNWEEGCFSTVVIELSEPELGTTVLQLKQTGIPEADAYGHEGILDTVETGWQSQVLTRIRQVFGFGA